MRWAVVVGAAWMLWLVTPANGRTLYVNGATGNDEWNGLCPVWDGMFCGPKKTIQAGIDAASNGDLVSVADGFYTGLGNRDLSIVQQTLTVKSENGPANCIIDCQGLGRGFYISVAEWNTPVIEGFTVSNGVAVDGGGIFCSSGTPEIRNCVIAGNMAVGDPPAYNTGSGGGVFGFGSNVVIVESSVIGNHATQYGGGVAGTISTPWIVNSVIEDNTSVSYGGGLYFSGDAVYVASTTIRGNASGAGGGGGYVGGGTTTIVNGLINGNEAVFGGGMHLVLSAATFVNCVLDGNRASYQGGALSMYGARFSQISNCIAWGNDAPAGPEIAIASDANLRVAYSNVFGGPSLVEIILPATLVWEAGNIDTDPLFVLPGAWDDNGTPGDPSDDFWVPGDYHINPGSPCIDVGDNTVLPSDILDLDGDGDTSEPIPYDLDSTPRRTDDPDVDNGGNGDPPIVDMGAYEFQSDCNSNGVPDYLDILAGTSPDANTNTIPDECEPKLALIANGDCFTDTITVFVEVSDCREPIVGGQFFLQYDPGVLDFVSIEPGDVGLTNPENPFEREIMEIVDPIAGEIDYAVGIPDGGSGAASPVQVAVITFTAAGEACDTAALVTFREHFPVTRLSGTWGHPVVPELFDLPTVTVDAVAPTLAVPPDVGIHPGDPTDPSFTGQATATDNCDPAPAVTWQDVVDLPRIFRTWRAEDTCGNADEAVQIITILYGDCDFDDDVDMDDMLGLHGCLAGPEQLVGSGCDCYDFDGDGDVDLHDFTLFQLAFLPAGV
jgi:hypothetical protein